MCIPTKYHLKFFTNVCLNNHFKNFLTVRRGARSAPRPPPPVCPDASPGRRIAVTPFPQGTQQTNRRRSYPCITAIRRPGVKAVRWQYSEGIEPSSRRDGGPGMGSRRRDCSTWSSSIIVQKRNSGAASRRRTFAPGRRFVGPYNSVR